MQDNLYKPGTLITFGLPSPDADFLAMLQKFVEREAERRLRIVPDWLSIQIDGVHQCVVESESGCRLEFEGGTSKVELVGRDAEGKVVIATYLPTYDGPKTEAWKVLLPWGDEFTCTFEYDDEECVCVDAKRSFKPELSEKCAELTAAPQQKYLGFDRAYVERLRDGDPSVEQHFAAYFEQFLNLKLRARGVPSDRVQDLRQETFIRVMAAVRKEGVVRQPGRFGAFVNSVCNNVLLEHYRSLGKNQQLGGRHHEIPDKVLDLEGTMVSDPFSEPGRKSVSAWPARARDLLRAVFLKKKDKDAVCREMRVGRNDLRVLLDRAKDKFSETVAKDRRLTGFDPSPGRPEPGFRPTHQMPRVDIHPVRVFLVADSPERRERLSRAFRNAGLSVVAQRGDCRFTAQDLAATRCHVLLVDPGRAVNYMAKTAVLPREISDFASRMRVIVFGMKEDPGCFLEAVRSGVLGYVLKDASAAEIISAVRSIMRGEAVCPPRLCVTLFRHLSQRPPQMSDLSQEEPKSVGDRQRELLALVARGLTNKEIAAQLHLTEQTVRIHMHRALRELQANDRLRASLAPLWDYLVRED